MSKPTEKTAPSKRHVLICVVGVAVWAAMLAGAFFVDEWGYRVVSRSVAAATGYRADRFGLAGGGGNGFALQLLRLLKEMGQFWFILVISVTMIVLDRRRIRQVIILWACIALAAVIGQGVMRLSIAKLRPDAALVKRVRDREPTEREAKRLNIGQELVAEVLKRWPDDQRFKQNVDRYMQMQTDEIRNVGKPLYRPPFSGYGWSSGLTFPSGHTAFAFAAFAAFAAFFAKGRWWFLILASLVGLSRVLMGEHFISDTIAGAGVGYVCAAILLAIPPIRRFGEGLALACPIGKEP